MSCQILFTLAMSFILIILSFIFFTTISEISSASNLLLLALILKFSSLLFTVPPVMSMFSDKIALLMSSNDKLYFFMSFSLTDISISSTGYPEILIFEIPSIAFKSSSISSAVFLS